MATRLSFAPRMMETPHTMIPLHRAWIGITVQGIDEKLARYLKVSAKRGVMVTSVEPQSPAQKAGLQEGLPTSPSNAAAMFNTQ